MKTSLIIILMLLSILVNGQNTSYNSLTDFEEEVILNKSTEQPYSGTYLNNTSSGTYLCKRCDAPLYNSTDKFDSHCGWPSFDDEIKGAVLQIPDSDGLRTEIVCANCNGHLGHIFLNEGFTSKNSRHCVNSISLKFEPKAEEKSLETAYFASGCFWGTEYHFEKTEGVISTTVGYTGGKIEEPTYREVCSGLTGHAETVKVVFDPQIVSFETLAKLFFETHDPSQIDRQGPDIGTQYRSEIFFTSETQQEVAENLIQKLIRTGHIVATQVTPATRFYTGESYHQDYYKKKGGSPYCHIYEKKF